MHWTPGFSLGYEPKPGRNAPRYARPLRRVPIPNEQIKVLPKFNYDRVARKRFELALTRMLRTIGANWLITNELRMISEHDDHTIGRHSSVSPAIFPSPANAEVRAALAPETAVSPARARAPVPLFTKTKPMRGGRSTSSPVDDPYGASPCTTHRPSKALGHIPGQSKHHDLVSWPHVKPLTPGQGKRKGICRPPTL